MCQIEKHHSLSVTSVTLLCKFSCGLGKSAVWNICSGVWMLLSEVQTGTGCFAPVVAVWSHYHCGLKDNQCYLGLTGTHISKQKESIGFLLYKCNRQRTLEKAQSNIWDETQIYLLLLRLAVICWWWFNSIWLNLDYLSAKLMWRSFADSLTTLNIASPVWSWKMKYPDVLMHVEPFKDTSGLRGYTSMTCTGVLLCYPPMACHPLGAICLITLECQDDWRPKLFQQVPQNDRYFYVQVIKAASSHNIYCDSKGGSHTMLLWSPQRDDVKGWNSQQTKKRIKPP